MKTGASVFFRTRGDKVVMNSRDWADREEFRDALFDMLEVSDGECVAVFDAPEYLRTPKQPRATTPLLIDVESRVEPVESDVRSFWEENPPVEEERPSRLEPVWDAFLHWEPPNSHHRLYRLSRHQSEFLKKQLIAKTRFHLGWMALLDEIRSLASVNYDKLLDSYKFMVFVKDCHTRFRFVNQTLAEQLKWERFDNLRALFRQDGEWVYHKSEARLWTKKRRIIIRDNGGLHPEWTEGVTVVSPGWKDSATQKFIE